MSNVRRRHPSWSSLDEKEEKLSVKGGDPWNTDEGSLDEDIPNKRPRRRSSSSSSSSTASSSSSISSKASRDQRRRSHSCTSYSSESSEKPLLELSEDADTELMCHRKRALALGHFQLLYRANGGVALEDTKAFREALKSFDGRVRYVKVPSGWSTSHYPSTRYAKLKMKEACPGLGTRFNVVWSHPSGEVKIDYAVKLYGFDAVHSVEIDCDAKSPKSPWFGLIDPRVIPTYDEKVNFDANVFWTVAFLFKHFGTCGIETWDKEIKEMKRHFSSHCSSPTDSKALPSRPQLAQKGSRRNENLTFLTGHEGAPSLESESRPSGQINARYTGCVTEWRGSFGFLSSTRIHGRIFLHASDIIWSSECKERLVELPIGASVNFELTLDGKNRYKAIEAKLFL